jgi:penicillin-binding protein 2
MKMGSFSIRIIALGVITLLALAGLVARLWWVQVARGDEYTAKVRGRSQVSVRLPAVRGEIMDRNGIALVENRASFELDFYLPDIVAAYRNEHGSLPKRPEKHRIIVRGMAEEREETDIAGVVNETIIPRLRELDLEQDYNAERLQVHYRNDTLIPYTYRQDLDFDTMARVLESNLGLPGLKADVKPVRHYPYGSLASHILGYVGAPVNTDQEEARKFNFYQPDVEGKAQIELAMDEYLRGKAGVRVLQRDVKGKILEEDVELIEPVPGNRVFLTIDARIQFITEQALRSVGRGAAVVVDVNTGGILAMASVPSFDPNVFIPAIAAADWAALNQDDTNPLLNRATSAYAPGSTYKIPIAIAGLRGGVGNRSFPCGGGIAFGDTFMKCHSQKHGSFALMDAIKVSCNGYFYRYGIATGIDDITFFGNLMGLGQQSGIPLSGESPGILPGKDWLTQRHPNDRWRDGYTANTSIGQGFVLATPLQIAMITAAVANGGTMYYPRLIDKVVSPTGEVVMEEPAKIRSNLITDGGIDPADFELVRKGMWKVVNEGGGTGRASAIKDMGVSGKTGTAQFKFQGKTDNRVWFMAFAPYDNPRYAVCVMVEGAKSGGGVAAPIVGKILEETFALDSAEEPFLLASLPPAVGNTKFVESVNFGRDIPAATTADPETTDVVEQPDPARAATPVAAPFIRDAPDERGRVEKPERERKGLLNFFNRGGEDTQRENSERPSNNSPRRPFRR